MTAQEDEEQLQKQNVSVLTWLVDPTAATPQEGAPLASPLEGTPLARPQEGTPIAALQEGALLTSPQEGAPLLTEEQPGTSLQGSTSDAELLLNLRCSV